MTTNRPASAGQNIMSNTNTAELANWLERYNLWRRDNDDVREEPEGLPGLYIRETARLVFDINPLLANALSRAASYLLGKHPGCPDPKEFGEWIDLAVEILRSRNPSGTATGIEAIVCADIASRQAMGIAKYGTTVADNPLELRAWLQHAYEETLDKAVYLRRAIAEIDSKGT